MPEFGGGFAGDRAGLMNLEGQLGNISQMNMRQQQMDTQRAFMQNMMQFRDQALANQMHQQALMTPGQLALQRAQAAWYNAMAKNAGGGVGQSGPANPSVVKDENGKPIAWTDPGNAVTDVRGGGAQVLGDTLAGGLGYFFTPGGPIQKGLGGAAAGTGMNILMNKAYDISHPGDVLDREAMANYDPSWTPTPTPAPGQSPRAGAMSKALGGVKSTSPNNVTKRANRGAGMPSSFSVPAPVSLPSAVQ